MNADTIISRVWSFSTVLEQLTYLIFLKMADEYSNPPYNRDLKIPEKYNWQTLIDKKGAELETHYVNLLEELGKESGLIGQIFVKAQNKIQDPAKLYRIVLQKTLKVVLDNILHHAYLSKRCRMY